MRGLVVVTVTGPDPKLVKTYTTPSSHSKDGITTLSCSGIFLESFQGILITSVASVYPFLHASYRGNLLNTPLATATKNSLLPGCSISCIHPGPPQQRLEADLLAIVEVPGAKRALQSLLNASSAAPWTLGWGHHNNGNSRANYSDIDIASHVAVLQLNQQQLPSNGPCQPQHPLQWYSSTCPSLGIGDRIEAYGCPFGSLVSLLYHGFTSGGIVSALVSSTIHTTSSEKITPKSTSSTSSTTAIDSTTQTRISQPAVVLSDLKCLPGMDGSPVMTMITGECIGLLAPPMRCPALGAEFSVILPAWNIIPAVTHTLNRILSARTLHAVSGLSGRDNNNGTRALTKNISNSSIVVDSMNSVVAIEVGSSWASGILITPEGHVLTNAHAVPRGRSGLRALVPCNSGHTARWHSADVLHIFTGPVDLAVIKLKQPTDTINNNSNNAFVAATLDASQSSLKQGRPVIVAGYPIWRPLLSSSDGTSPLIGAIATSGNIAKVLPSTPPHHSSATTAKYLSIDAVMLTTAPVHSGASGGAVIDPGSGAILGLITSNTKVTRPELRSGVHPELYPCMNYCIPSSVLNRVATELLLSGNERRRGVDWRQIEEEFRENGVMAAWKSIHNAQRWGDDDNSEGGGGLKPALPPKMAVFMDMLKNTGRRRGEGVPKPRL